MSLTEFSVKNPVLINIIMVIVFVAGFYTTATIPKEEMPNVDFGMFVITVAYPGVSPTDIETEIIEPVEEELEDLDDVRFMESTAKEGIATITIEMDDFADVDKAEDEIHREVNKIKNLPEGASDIEVKRINMKEMNSICSIVFSGPYTENGLREISEDLSDEITNIDNVSKVEIVGTREREIRIQVDVDKLDQYNLTYNQIQNAIDYRNKNMPGGEIMYKNEEFLLRSMAEFESVKEIGETILKSDSYGNKFKIKDVAAVKDTLEDSETIAKLNSEASVTLLVYKMEEGNIIKVMDEVREAMEDFQNQLPDLELEIRNDGSVEVNESMNTLSTNAILGIILVFIVLWMFIGWKNALFAAWGLPFSILLTFIFMQFFNVTINNLSLFALILVLGMIVDDAIIVIENVQRYIENGLNVKEATIKGTKEIMWPVISAVATTISAFTPLLMMKGKMGVFLKLFPIVVILALAASLLECLVVLPSHIAEMGGTKKTKKNKGANRLTNYLVSKYKKGIVWALKHRKTVIALLIVGMLISIGLVASGAIKMEFFPKQTSNTIVLNLKMPTGTSLEKSNEIVTKIETHILNMNKNDDIEAVVTNVGQLQENHRIQTQTNYAEIRIDVVEADKMKYNHKIIKENINKYLRRLTEIESYVFKTGGHGGPPTGEDIELRIEGKDFQVFEEINTQIINLLEKMRGVTEIESSLSDGKKEIRIYPDWERLKIYGINENAINSMIRTASYGQEIGIFRGSSQEAIDIKLEADTEFSSSLNDIQNLKVSSQNGQLIALSEIANFVISDGYAIIEHYDSERNFTITASVSNYEKDGKTYNPTPNEINASLQGTKGKQGVIEKIISDYPGYEIEFGGQTEQQEETYGSLYFAFGIAMLLVYAILGTQFQSYVQPLIVMLTIPFAMIGVIFGLFITNLPLSLMTMISFVALCGIVVNDSLVLVDFVNKARAKGHDRWNSLIEAGSIRLRPIIMTTVTTIAGFMPMIISSASATKDFKPMAVAIAFGLAFATILTLFVIPVIYSIIDSIFGKLGVTRFSTHISLEKALKNSGLIK